jgi:hypothetical protein
MWSTVIRCAGAAGDFPCDTIGQYLEFYDFEYADGRGLAKFTPDPAKAKKFSSRLVAIEYWRTISRTVPRRPDGQPNRPLTAYHILIEELPLA